MLEYLCGGWLVLNVVFAALMMLRRDRPVLEEAHPTDSPSRPRPPVPIEIRPQVGAALAADRANEPMLNVGQPKVIGPLIGA
jgi:hypothetical protein